ncbi:carbohydrate ABC transporter permease [Cellulosilyticum sp. I15G10I2]|uniref:carbohydrate ABC transporter permease n=1 Tax=Cellulosilyticum sp. I15G10I2 TaxID=1892843 RepID=UPI00085BBC0A|nr:sugar ABC transporter permease [Cellulosilyticum sp. I15G10I2]
MKYKSLIMPKKMYWFVVPALILFLTFWIIPIFSLFRYSITNFNGINPNYDIVGLKNFETLYKQGILFNSIKNTLIYAAILVVFGNVTALTLAMALNVKLKGKSFYRSAIYIPTLFSAIVVGFIWSYVYMPDKGMISSMMHVIGLDGSKLNILGNFKTALYGISVVDIWKNVGSTMIIYLAGLQMVDESLLEAGKIDGCNEWQLIRLVKLPLISASITINVVLGVINGLKAFDYAFIMTNGGPGTSTNTLMFTIYKIAFTEQQFGKASAFSVAAFLVIIVITVAMLIFMNKKEVEL